MKRKSIESILINLEYVFYRGKFHDKKDEWS